MNKKETRRYVLQPKEVEPVPYHDIEKAKKAVASANILLDNSMTPDADMVIHVAEYRNLQKPVDTYVDPHKHAFSSFYGVIGDLTIEVTLEGDRYEVSGPGSVFIPPGMMHSIRALKGDGHVLIVLRNGKYE